MNLGLHDHNKINDGGDSPNRRICFINRQALAGLCREIESDN